MDADADILRQRTKTVLTAIIFRAGGEYEGKTRLYKAFYYAHLWYFQNFPGTLTDWPIFRGPFGPAIDNGDELLDEMISDGVIAVATRPVGDHSVNFYRLMVKPGDVPDAVLKAADFGIGKVGDRSAKAVSDETHENSREWKRRSTGAILNIYADLLDDESYIKMEREQANLAALLAGVLS